MILNDFIESMNRLGQQKVPFLFLIDFEMKKPFIVRLDEVDPTEILFSIQGFTNAIERIHSENIAIEKSVGSLVDYKKKFDKVLDHLAYGDSFLTNLTVKTEVKLSCSLQDLFYQS